MSLEPGNYGITFTSEEPNNIDIEIYQDSRDGRSIEQKYYDEFKVVYIICMGIFLLTTINWSIWQIRVSKTNISE